MEDPNQENPTCSKKGATLLASAAMLMSGMDPGLLASFPSLGSARPHKVPARCSPNREVQDAAARKRLRKQLKALRQAGRIPDWKIGQTVYGYPSLRPTDELRVDRMRIQKIHLQHKKAAIEANKPDPVYAWKVVRFQDDIRDQWPGEFLLSCEADFPATDISPVILLSSGDFTQALVEFTGDVADPNDQRFALWAGDNQ